MSRIRTIKPDFFRHEGLFEAEIESGLPLRVAFAGLWTVADRDGRFRWRPRQLKLDVLPFDDLDFSRVLDALRTRGFIVRYASCGEEYGSIPSWAKHQIVNNRECASTFPEPPATQASPPESQPDQPNETAPESPRVDDASATREPRVDRACGTPLKQDQGEGEGEGKRKWKGESARGARLPKDWAPGEVHMAFAESLGLRNGRALAELDKFRDYWAAQPGQRGVKADWTATWRNWVRRAAEGAVGKPDRDPFAGTT